MRIGFDATPAIKQLGGVTEYTRQLITHLALIDKVNHYDLVTFSLFRSQTVPLPKLPPNFRERAVPLPATVVNRMWRRAGIPPLELFTGPVDLLLFPNIFIPRPFSRAIVTVHDLAWLRFPDLAPPGESEQFRTALLRVVKNSRQIIAVSEATKRDLIEITKIAPQKVTVIYEGYDEALRRKPAAGELVRFRRKFNLGTTPYLLHVGTIEPRKNLIRLIHAYQLFRERTELPHKLIFVGRIGWDEDVPRAISVSKYRADIVMTGPISDAERRLAYWGSEMVVFPSYYEGFGLPIIEAQAAERPVIAGTGGSLAEVGGDSVMTVDVRSEKQLAEEIGRLAGNPDLREGLRKRGLKNIQRFSWHNAAKETLELFQRLAK